MEFYSDTDPWHFPTDRYPTWDDCMRFYMSRITNREVQKSILYDLAVSVEKIWRSGDGCPKSQSTIIYQFEKTVLPAYQKSRKGDTGGQKKKKKKKTVPLHKLLAEGVLGLQLLAVMRCKVTLPAVDRLV